MWVGFFYTGALHLLLKIHRSKENEAFVAVCRILWIFVIAKMCRWKEWWPLVSWRLTTMRTLCSALNSWNKKMKMVYRFYIIFRKFIQVLSTVQVH